MTTLPPNPGIYHDTTVCELVLEDVPDTVQGSLAFESFPLDIEETYALNEYREMGGDRMPQPRFVAYRGGNWTPFTLQLIFRAGNRQAGTVAQTIVRQPARTQTDAQLQQLLIAMEKKVRWCQALAFPLERALGGVAIRQVFGQAQADRGRGVASSSDTTNAINSLRRNDPPIVLIVYGSWWVQRCYVKNVSVKWTSPFHPVTVRPYGAEVNITFQPIKAVYPTFQLISDQAGISGYNSDNKSPLISGVVDDSRQSTAQRAADNAGQAGSVAGG
jgi:hypothetical protein